MPFKRVYVSKKAQYQASSCDEEVTIVPPKWQTDRFLTKPVFFWKPNEPYGYLCQWYQSNMTDENGQTFNCCEQYMMWHKAKAFGDCNHVRGPERKQPDEPESTRKAGPRFP